MDYLGLKSTPESVATKEDVDAKVDKVVGKGLSTEDYTTAEKTKLSGVATGATANSTDASLRDRSTHTGTQAISTVSGLQTALDSKAVIADSTVSTTTTYSSTKLEGIFTAFTGTLNGLEADFNTGYNTLDAAKVDKVTGKGLSTEDYTTAEKNKLAGLVHLHARNGSSYSLSSTTLVDITDMALTLDANSVYQVDFRITYTTNNSVSAITAGFADFTSGAIPQLDGHNMSAPAGGSGASGGIFKPLVNATGITLSAGASTSGVNLLILINGRVYTGSSPLVLTPQVASINTTGAVSIAVGMATILATKVA